MIAKRAGNTTEEEEGAAWHGCQNPALAQNPGPDFPLTCDVVEQATAGNKQTDLSISNTPLNLSIQDICESMTV